MSGQQVQSFKGSIVVDELIIPITDIYLDRGQIWVVATVAGPVPDVDTRDYVINGRDGKTVVRALGISGLRWSRVLAGDSLTVVAPVSFTDRMAAGVGG